MSDVFISYKNVDRTRVEPLHSALTAEGFSVWWDRGIPGGTRWREQIAIELERALCVLVVWSSSSSSGDFVCDEAHRAMARDVLLPVRIDRITPPLGFGELQTLDLVGWRGSRADPRFTDVLEAVRATLDGRPRSSLRWPALRRRRRQLAFAVSIPLMLATTLTLSADARSATCWIPGVHSLCAHYGIGGVATPDEEQLFQAALDQTNGDGLRDYLQHYPRGVYAQEANSRLATCRWDTRSTWADETKPPLPLAVRSEGRFSTEAEARDDALARAPVEAEFLCTLYKTAPFRLKSPTPFNVDRWLCSQNDEGWACGFDGQAQCEVEARKTHRVEVCSATP